MKKSFLEFPYLKLLFVFPSPGFSFQYSNRGVLTSDIKGSTNDIVETILEQFLEAGQLLWIQIHQFIDPGSLGFSAAFYSYFSYLQQNPMALIGLSFFAISIPFFIYRIVQTSKQQRKEREELLEILEAEEDQNYDFEAEFKKQHVNSKMGDEKEEDELEDYEDDSIEKNPSFGEEDQEEATTIKIVEDNFSIGGGKTDDFSTAMEPTDIDIAKLADTIDLSNDIAPNSAKQSFKKSKISPDSETESIAEQLEQQFAILENEFRDTDDSLDKEVQSQKPIDQKSKTILEQNKEDSADQPKPATNSVQNEENDELSNIQKEMERNIDEISQHLAEDEVPDANIPVDPDYSEQVVSDSNDIISQKNSDDEFTDLTAGDFLKAIGVEPSTNIPEPISNEDKDDEEEYLKTAERLLQEMDENPEETTTADSNISPLEEKFVDPKQDKATSSSVESTTSLPQSSESKTGFSEISKVETDLRKTIPPVKTKSYLNRLEAFQRKLEDRVKLLENDPVLNTPNNFNTLTNYFNHTREKTSTASLSPRKEHYSKQERKQRFRKAYSLDVLESLLLLENQKK